MIRDRRSLLLALTLTSLTLALGAGCGLSAGKPEVQEDFTDLAGLDEKSDAFSYRMKVLGTLTFGQTSAPRKHNGTPRFHAWKFAGQKGESIDAWVRSTSGGDAVAWLLDDKFNVVLSNDDADETTYDARLAGLLKKTSTHYIVYRDYDLFPNTFVTSLGHGRQPPVVDYTSCDRDSDCERVESGCCHLGIWKAVRADQTAAYTASLNCPEHQICPLILIRDDHSLAQCNTETHQCEMKKPAEIACGGHTVNPHACPTNFQCTGAALLVDGTGTCAQQCGGIQGLQCEDVTQTCGDAPNGGCHIGTDPDCMGLCSAPKTDCRTTGCPSGKSCIYCWASFACIPDGALC